MAALTAERNTPILAPVSRPPVTYGIAAATKIWKGSLVALNAAGDLVPGSTSTALLAVGVALKTVDNTGAAAAKSVDVIMGVARYTNADSITKAQRGQQVYIVDDQTVSKAGVGKSVAGICVDVDSDGVWIMVELPSATDLDISKISIVTVPIKLVAHSNGSIAARFTPGFNGRILKHTQSVWDPATTAAKLATFTPAIGATPTTGGAVALTSANCTPVGATVNGSAITALNAFTDTDEITLVASAVTAFVEGQTVAYLMLQAA